MIITWSCVLVMWYQLNEMKAESQSVVHADVLNEGDTGRVVGASGPPRDYSLT